MSCYVLLCLTCVSFASGKRLDIVDNKRRMQIFHELEKLSGNTTQKDVKHACDQRVNLVLDGVYGRFFQKAFSDWQEAEKDEQRLFQRLRRSLKFHCETSVKGSCDIIRNKRFDQKMPSGSRNLPQFISPHDPNCFDKDEVRFAHNQQACGIIWCYRELTQKNCLAVHKSKNEEAAPNGNCY